MNNSNAGDGSQWDFEQVRQHNKVNEIDDDIYHLPGDPINEAAITETSGDS